MRRNDPVPEGVLRDRSGRSLAPFTEAWQVRHVTAVQARECLAWLNASLSRMTWRGRRPDRDAAIGWPGCPPWSRRSPPTGRSRWVTLSFPAARPPGWPQPAIMRAETSCSKSAGGTQKPPMRPTAFGRGLEPGRSAPTGQASWRGDGASARAVPAGDTVAGLARPRARSRGRQPAAAPLDHAPVRPPLPAPVGNVRLLGQPVRAVLRRSSLSHVRRVRSVCLVGRELA